MTPVKDPGDANVVPVAHSAGKHGAGLPGVRQLVVRHAGSVPGKPNRVQPRAFAELTTERQRARLLRDVSGPRVWLPSGTRLSADGVRSQDSDLDH